MARGYPGAFGRHVNSLYVWLPLCLLFLAPFFDWRRPLRMVNLDLLALSSLSISLGVLQPRRHLRIRAARLPAARLPARRGCCGWLAPARGAPAAAAAELGAAGWLLGAVGCWSRFRDRAQRRRLERHRRRLRERRRRAEGDRTATPSTASFPATISRGDTYGPVSYEAYVPFVAAVRLQRHLGLAARRPRRGDLLRPPLRSGCCSRSAGGSAARRPGSCSPTPGPRIRSPPSRSSPTPTTRSSPRSCSRRCSPPASPPARGVARARSPA